MAVFPTAEIDCIPDLNTPPLLEKPVFVDSNGDDNLDLDAVAKEMLNDSKGGSAARAFVYSGDKSDVAHIRMRVRYTASPGHRSMNIGFRYGTDERYKQAARGNGCSRWWEFSQPGKNSNHSTTHPEYQRLRHVGCKRKETSCPSLGQGLFFHSNEQ